MSTKTNAANGKAREDLERLFFIVANFAARCGFSDEEIAAMVTAATDSNVEERPRRAHETTDTSILPEHVDFLSYLIGLWSQDGRYVDDVGKIRSIPERGPAPSLHDLYAKAVDKSLPLEDPLEFDRALKLLKMHNAIVEGGDDLWIAPSIGFRSNSDNSVAIVQQAAYLRDFAETIYFNVSKREAKTEGRFQYVTTVRGFPTEKLPMINRALRDEGLFFLENVDDLLVTERVKHLAVNAEKRRVGVGVYFFERPD